MPDPSLSAAFARGLREWADQIEREGVRVSAVVVTTAATDPTIPAGHTRLCVTFTTPTKEAPR